MNNKQELRSFLAFTATTGAVAFMLVMLARNTWINPPGGKFGQYFPSVVVAVFYVFGAIGGFSARAMFKTSEQRIIVALLAFAGSVLLMANTAIYEHSRGSVPWMIGQQAFMGGMSVWVGIACFLGEWGRNDE